MPNTGADPITHLLDRQPTLILDGALATELENRGCDLSDTLWSAQVLLDRPQLIQELHLDYLAAGADCIIAASYQASVAGLLQHGLTEAEAETALRQAVAVATTARDQFWSEQANRRGRLRPLVAASIGPYGAFLADGSEYRGDYDIGTRALARFHRSRLLVLADSGADLLACETIPSAAEAETLVRLLEETPRTVVWISFSCKDGKHICDGTELEAIARDVAASPQVVAIGINCTHPRFVDELVAVLARAITKPIVIYPNSGEGWDAHARSWLPSETVHDLASAAPNWIAAGARLVGGCCRTGPEDIRRLRRAVLAEAG